MLNAAQRAALALALFAALGKTHRDAEALTRVYPALVGDAAPPVR